jgi:hypothetical protein
LRNGSYYRRRSKRITSNSKGTTIKKLNKSQSNDECYYDLDFDWDIIVSSFLQQYGIRLNQEYDTISYVEFNQLLAGINGDTPLGYAVQIRAETDAKKIKEMTNHEKKIRAEWQEFRNKQNKKKDNYIYLSKDQISSVLSGMF